MNLDTECFGPAGQLVYVSTKLLSIPADGLPKLFRHAACFDASHHRKHLAVAVALDELDWNIEVQQARECFTWHRSRKHVAPDHHMVYICLTNILEYSLECREVSVNVIERSDSHNRPFLPIGERFSLPLP